MAHRVAPLFACSCLKGLPIATICHSCRGVLRSVLLLETSDERHRLGVLQLLCWFSRVDANTGGIRLHPYAWAMCFKDVCVCFLRRALRSMCVAYGWFMVARTCGQAAISFQGPDLADSPCSAALTIGSVV